MAISLVAPKEGNRASAVEEQLKKSLSWHALNALKESDGQSLLPAMATLCISAGRKDKLRPGDILGALTGIGGLTGAQVGKISIFDHQAYVAVERLLARQTQQRLEAGKIKGRSLKIRVL